MDGPKRPGAGRPRLASWERAGGEGGAERRVGSEEIEDDGDCGEARARCGCGVASAGL